MKLHKKGGQKYPNIAGRVTGEYEIRTFKGNQRVRSPMETTFQPMRRSPNIKKESQKSDSNFGEMFYVEPNDSNFRRGQNMSPLNDSNNINSRSPLKESNYDNIRGKVINMNNRVQNMNILNNPNYIPNTNMEESRSPSPPEQEYNYMSINRIQNNSNSPQNNYVGDGSYNMILNDTGNIFLDQPMQQVGVYVPQMENENEGMGGNSLDNREIQFPINPRDFQEPSPGILQKMSPKGNVEGDSESNSEKNDNVNEINDLKTQLDKNMHVILKNEDGIGIGDKNRNIRNRGDMENIEIMAKAKEFQDNTNTDGIKKLIKYYVRTYDPKQGQDGNLISNYQVIMPSNQDNLFNERYKVLQKMNKLSNILLSKRKGSFDSSDLNRSFNEDTKTKFDRNTLTNAKILTGKSPIRLNNRKNKLLYVSLAMLSAKGPNTEDRTIFRKMRLDKGGVVDLAQENIQKKSKFKIKKARIAGRGITTLNPKYREKAAKIVQSWWRDIRERYKRMLEQIVKIQSVWRGKFTRKYIYDVIYISYLQEKFLNIMRNVLVNHVRPYVFDELFSKNKLIKNVLSELLIKYHERLKLLTLNDYLQRWRYSSNLMSLRLIKSKQLLDKKEQDENKLYILKKYFDKWVLIKNLTKYMGKAKNAEEKRKKFFGTLNIVNGLTELTKRQIFKNTKGPIMNYLKDFLKQKLLVKIFKKKCAKDLNDKIRNTFNKWRLNTQRKKLDNFRNEEFIKKLNNIQSRYNNKNKKDVLNKLIALIPKYKNLIKVKNGFNALEKLALKKNIKYPIDVMKIKINNENKNDSVNKFLSIKKRNLNLDLRSFFDKWKNNKIRLDDKDKRNEVYKHLLKNIISKIQKRILYKRFNQWRQKPQININEELKKINTLVNSLHDYIKNGYNIDRKKFLQNLKKTRDKHALNKAANKIFKIIDESRKLILKYYLYQLRSDIKNEEIKDLHRQLLKYIISFMNIKNNRNLLSKYLSKWKLYIEDNRNNEYLDKLRTISKGSDILNNIYKRRPNDFMKKLYQKMNKDYRPIILGQIIKKIDKPRTSLKECLLKWKNNLDNKKAKDIILKYKAKIVDINAKNLKNKNDNSKLIKTFFHWKAMSRKPEEYYPRINNLINTIKRYIKKKASSEPFDKIKKSINPTRYLLKLIKNRKNQDSRLLTQKLRNILGRWRKSVVDNNSTNLKTKIMYNIKLNIKESEKKKLLSKYFTKWRLNCVKRELNINFIKGITKLTNILRRPVKSDIYNAFKQKIKEVEKKKKLNKLMKILDSLKNYKLHNSFLKLWKTAMKKDPERDTKINTKLKKILKNKELNPISKLFKAWIKNVHLYQLKDKDKYHSIKMIVNILKNIEKMNAIKALGLWRRRIYKIKEEYLKALLLKHIKTSQKAKEKMSNETKLRLALLKWRSNIISMNYYDNLKKIRKGCKLLKLGAKKMHEEYIMNNLKDLVRKSKVNNLLKKILNNNSTKLNKESLKKYFDKWKSILEDIKKDKNKLSDLFEKYLNSEKIHKNIFEKPKLDIINLAKNYDDKKKKAAEKIVKFVKRIVRIKENNKIMERNKLLSGIIKTKNEHMDIFKRLALISLFRQTQKIKNNENARKIQRFIKVKLRKYLNKKNMIRDGLNKIDLLIKRNALDKIKNKSINKKNLEIFKLIIEKREQKNKSNLLRNKLNNWKEKINQDKNISIIKIQNLLRKHSADKILKNLKKRIIILKSIHDNQENKKKIKLAVILRDWLHKALMIRNNDSAKIIQDKFRKVRKNQKEKEAKEKLKKLFYNNFKHKIAKILEKVSRIAGNKGEVLNKILIDSLLRKPYDKLIFNMKILGRTNALNKIFPKLYNQVKNNYLSKYIKKWKVNTYDETIKFAIILQNYLKEKYNEKLESEKKRRDGLLQNIINKKTKNNLYKLALPFKIWNKKVKLENINNNAIKIQNNVRKYLSKKKLKDLKAATKFMNLIKNIKTKKLLDIVKKVKDMKMNEAKKKNLLYKLISNKDEFNNKSNLEKYFIKWKNNTKKSNNNVTKIQNNFRIYLAKKKRDKYMKINSLLKKYILKHENKNNDLKRSKLRKWLKNNNLIKLTDKINLIQNTMKPFLAKIKNDKYKEFFNKNAKKKIAKILLEMSKVNKFKKCFNKIYGQILINKLKKNKFDQKKKNNINNGANIANDRIKNLMTKMLIKKWKRVNIDKYNKANNSALLIQKNYRAYLARKDKNKLMKIKKLLLSIILRKDKLVNYKICGILRKWNSIANMLNYDNKAKKIQEQYKKYQDKLNKDKELAKELKIKNGLEKLINIKFGAKHALNKIKSQKNRKIFNKFNDALLKKRKDILKNVFDRIKKTGSDNVLRKALDIQNDLKKRIIKKTLLNFKDKTNQLAKFRAVQKIIKNWKIYLNNNQEKNKIVLLKSIIRKLIEKKSNIRKKYLNKWCYITRILRDDETKRRIAKYFAKAYKISNSRKNWKTLYDKLKIKNRNYNLMDILKRLKKRKSINRINELLAGRAAKKVVDKLKQNKHKDNIHNKLLKLIPSINKNNNNQIIQKYLLKWKDITNKLNHRESLFKNALNIIDKRQVIDSADIINKIMIIKKLLHDIPFIRAKYFIKKLKGQAENSDKLNKLKDAIIKAKNDLNIKDKKNVMNKIYKIYVYHKINNFIKSCNNYEQRLKNIYSKDFLQKLIEIRTKNAAFNYNNELESTNKAKLTKLNFKTKNKKNYKIIYDKNAAMRKVLPSLLNYVSNKFKKRKEEAFEKIKSELINKSFANILKNYATNFSKPKILELVRYMKRDVKYSEIRPRTQIKLFKLFRKKYIKYVTSSLIEPSRLYRLYYLCNITRMHSTIAAQRYYRELIRKWRFITFSKKMTRKKLELMYKNLHASYLQMADEIFGEDKINPSVFKEFERFGTDIGMFTGQEPHIDEELNKKYYTSVDKKYTFTTKASGALKEAQNNKKEEFTQKINEGKKVEINQRVAQSSKNIQEQFDSIKKSGLSKNYFSKK